ncbi:hypothetical protein C1645_743799 [Glomus cerebriforme]|uniref:Uncharacterized protein n=1 Tax=Glomus cerebriforme TaxID=658196 RepID=A0A397S7U0_9GLOM|nr:hypothetical protein C1645_743799 [Glomus cerebriforme]
MSSEFDELRQENARLKAENMELRRELNTRNNELEKAIANSSAEIGKLNAKIVELEKYKLAIDKLESENAEFRIRFTKLEQDHGQTQDSEEVVPEITVSAINVPSSVMDQCDKKSESEVPDKEMDVFLDEVHKKKVSDKIRQRNREKKLMRETPNQEASPISQNPISTTCNERKNGQGLIQEISSSMPEEKIPGVSNHVTTISETAWSRKSDTINSESTFQGASMIEVSQHLAQLYDKALIAKECTLEANQEEIFCWCQYGRNFVFQMEALCDKIKLAKRRQEV